MKTEDILALTRGDWVGDSRRHERIARHPGRRHRLLVAPAPREPAAAAVPVDAYGNLPSIEQAALSARQSIAQGSRRVVRGRANCAMWCRNNG